VKGDIAGDFLPSWAHIECYVKINDIEVSRQGQDLIGTHLVFPLNVEITQWLRQGTNSFEFGFERASGIAVIWQSCGTVNLEVTATGTVTPPPPNGGWDWTKIAVIGGLFVAAIAVFGYAAGKIAPRVRHRYRTWRKRG
jgi:hypothetical protein